MLDTGIDAGLFGRDVGAARIGVAHGVTRALIGKVLNDRGKGSSEILLQALQWAIGESADVVSMSIGFDFPTLMEDRIAMGWKPRQVASGALVAYGNNLRLFDAMMAMVRARARFNEGTVIIAASGNESDRLARHSASLPRSRRRRRAWSPLARSAGRAARMRRRSSPTPRRCSARRASPLPRPGQAA
jgi:subtilisin family serine protease